LHFTTLQLQLRYTTLITRYTTLQLQVQLQLQPHYFTLHYTRLHYTILHYSTKHYSTLHYATLHYTSYATPQLNCNCDYSYTTLITLHCNYNSTTLYNYNYNWATLNYILYSDPTSWPHWNHGECIWCKYPQDSFISGSWSIIVYPDPYFDGLHHIHHPSMVNLLMVTLTLFLEMHGFDTLVVWPFRLWW
jgi:hypothetical protein